MKYSIITLLLLTVALQLNAQKDFRPYVGIGVHGGYNMTFVDFASDSANNERGINTQFYGIIINFLNIQHLGIQLEINMSQRGWQEGHDSILYYKRKMEYLEIPLLTHIALGKRVLRYTFDLGPYIAFHRNFTEDFESQTSNSNNILIPDEHKDLYGKEIDNKFDYGFMIGTGFGINTVLGQFLVHVRYCQGLSHIMDQFPDTKYYGSQMKSYYAGISYTYNIALTKNKH